MIQYYLIIDQIRVPNLVKILVKKKCDFGFLYQGTIWEPFLRQSPIWIRIKKKDKLWNRWRRDPFWKTSGVVFGYYKNSLGIDDLKKIITIYGINKKLYFLRFYSPQVLTNLLPLLTKDELNLFLANSVELNYFSYQDNKFKKLSNNKHYMCEKTIILSQKVLNLIDNNTKNL